MTSVGSDHCRPVSERRAVITVTAGGVSVDYLDALAKGLLDESARLGVTAEDVRTGGERRMDADTVPHVLIAAECGAERREVEVVWNRMPIGAVLRPVLVVAEADAARLAVHRLWNSGCTAIALLGVDLSARDLAIADGYARALAEIGLAFDPTLVKPSMPGLRSDRLWQDKTVGVLAAKGMDPAGVLIPALAGPVLCLEPTQNHTFVGARPQRIAAMAAMLLFDTAARHDPPAVHEVPVEFADAPT